MNSKRQLLKQLRRSSTTEWSRQTSILERHEFVPCADFGAKNTRKDTSRIVEPWQSVFTHGKSAIPTKRERCPCMCELTLTEPLSPQRRSELIKVIQYHVLDQYAWEGGTSVGLTRDVSLRSNRKQTRVNNRTHYANKVSLYPFNDNRVAYS